MITVNAFSRNPRVSRKIYNWQGYTAGNLSAEGNRIVPIMFSTASAREIVDNKEKDLTLDYEGKTYKVKPSKVLVSPDESCIDELDFVTSLN